VLQNNYTRFLRITSIRSIRGRAYNNRYGLQLQFAFISVGAIKGFIKDQADEPLVLVWHGDDRMAACQGWLVVAPGRGGGKGGWSAPTANEYACQLYRTNRGLLLLLGNDDRVLIRYDTIQ